VLDRVLIANRGEIAIRIIQACRELGIDAVAVYSDTDETAKHVRLADDAYHIGKSVARKSYLDQEAIIEAAREADADAIHPGYGFLAENTEFAANVEDSDFEWIGPPSDVMADFGEKTKARKIMDRADVPIVPGTTDPVESADEVREFGEEHGYPIAIKADGGGGGRGLKVVHSEDEVDDQLEDAKREGEAYFDNASVYVERFLENPATSRSRFWATNTATSATSASGTARRSAASRNSSRRRRAPYSTRRPGRKCGRPRAAARTRPATSTPGHSSSSTRTASSSSSR